MSRARVTVIAAVAATAGLVAGCGASSSPTVGSSAKPAGASTSTSTSCTSLAYTWAHSGGGLAGTVAVGRDFGKLAGDFPKIVAALEGKGSQSKALNEATNDASQLGSDARYAVQLGAIIRAA